MIAYFSCTGNSQRVAQLLAERLVDNVVDLRPLLRTAEPSVSIDGGKLVFVFPIHSWGPKALPTSSPICASTAVHNTAAWWQRAATIADLPPGNGAK